MDQVDSLNEIMSSVLKNTSMTDVGVSVNNVVNTSPVIAVAADLPSFQYFISEQAKSILALQELQNEVGALLEFRDLVMEAFPQLGQKMQTFSNTLQSQSPSKWEPGIRVKRKLGQQLREQEMLVSSLLPRYRSNSQGKTSRSGEISGSAASSSAIQDSGFCTESNKDHSSAISTRSKSRETEDELFSLLDHIHNKGTRLKLEVEYLWSRLNRKNNLSFPGTKRRCKSLDDLILTNTTHSFTFECAVKTAFLETELGSLKRERDILLKKMSEIESEHLANLAQTNRLLLELETISAEKRDLEERLQVAIHSENEINNRISDLHHNFLTRNQWRNAQTPFAKCQLLKLMQVFKGTNRNAEDGANNAILSSVAASPEDDYFKPNEHSQDLKNVLYSENTKVDRPINPVTKELNANSYQADNQNCKTKDSERGSHKEITTTTTSVVTLTSTKEFSDTIDHKIDYSASIGKPDVLIGFLSSQPLSTDLSKKESGITLSKERVLSILSERNIKELHRFLLTLSYQVEALNLQIQRISKSRMNVFQQLNKYKSENEELKFQLEEKNIQLEGTKAKVRVLERMRNEKLSYSTSDLMTDIPKSSRDTRMDPAMCPVSDTALMNERIGTTLSNCNSAKCTDLRDHSDKGTKSSIGRRSFSKIPLKTCSSSKLPTKLNSSNKKTLTSFKEYSAPGPPHSSCISSSSSSLNNK
ncbi:hypothetical protein PGB90_008697 [Kerria lacca]